MEEPDLDIGHATIVYEHPEEGTVETQVQNELIVYFQDHWILKRESETGDGDIVRRIPSRRVHYVDRSVEEFEEEVATRFDQVQSYLAELQSKLPINRSEERQDPHRIDIGDEEREEPSPRP